MECPHHRHRPVHGRAGAARLGRYTDAEANRGLPTRLLEKYFLRKGTAWQARDELRRMVEFRPLNLIDPWPALPVLDVVLLRNVLIYFDVAAKRGVLERVRKVLRRTAAFSWAGPRRRSTSMTDMSEFR